MTEPNPIPPPEPQKPGPNLKNLSKALLDQVAVLANEIKALPDAKKPVEAIQTFMRSFDKLALRCAREATILADAENPSQINPLVQVTAINVAGALKAAARDIEQGQGSPAAWETLGNTLNDQKKIAQACQLLISQTGIAATVVQPGEPLKTPDGKPLADS